MADETSTAQGNSGEAQETSGANAGAGDAGAAAGGAAVGGDGSQQPNGAAHGAESTAEGEEKPDGADAGEDGAAADIELKAPEGLELDAKVLDGFKAKAKELGLDSAKAQGVLDFYASVQKEAADAFRRQVDGWLEAVKQDKELGGAALKETQAHALRFMKEFATPELKEFLGVTGLGNHPEMVRLAARVGKRLAEDTVSGASGNGAESPANSKEAFLRAMYPSMYPKAG